MVNCDLIIRGGKVVAPAGIEKVDVAVAGGQIVQVAADLSGQAATEIDASNLHIFPGLIDAHVHFNEPGRTEWEGFSTGSAALVAGGGTCFFDMPLNASPPTLDRESFDAKRRAAEVSSHADFALWGGLTPHNLDKLPELADRGVIGFKAFMCDSGIADFPCADDQTLARGMAIAASLGLPVAIHAEDQELTSRMTAQARKAGLRGVQDYLATRPIEAELRAVRRAIELAQETGCSLHIVHVSSVEAARLIAASKGRVNITDETCPHYLALTELDLQKAGARAKCSPPLRPPEEAAGLWAQVLAGEFDLLASDHSPAPASMKQSDDFFAVWGGIAAVQSTLSILLSLQPHAPPEQIARLTAGNVARRFALAGKGQVAAGFDADLTLVDLDATYTLRREQLLDRHQLSPYVGRTMRGVVRRTILRGQTVFCDGKVVGPPRGRLITPMRRPGHV